MLKGKKDETVIDTIIGTETVIEGKISLPTSLRIDGKIYGEVECSGDVFIGKDGYAEPSIKAKNIVISGEVNGDVVTSEKIHIQPSGKLSGSAISKGIIIEDGGVFNGNSTIEESDATSSKKKKKQAKEPKQEVANG
ncbi:polymer-forming cytoskeletal protein [Ornithinibacillus sp. L9]|uniref:Polymer-forming cytoskeletal protein n=1 Tax=Ornithinibacillus caprae TaxID=2678566 RepID=A0A6N8FJN2_9BACI|nr:polymer-forming cytoskeletal protein [Ornithinibacillus caprae]MUK88177.1 polymer-forming cytoskeletal protein [Ornithinibacillus caprae]